MTTTTTQTLGPLQRAWVDKLRNGGFSQTIGQLHDRKGYCCLGVALEHVLGVEPVGESEGVCIYEHDGVRTSSHLPPKAVDALGLRRGDLPKAVADDIQHRLGRNGAAFLDLANMNDDGFTFAEIADLIEKHPSAFFKEAR